MFKKILGLTNIEQKQESYELSDDERKVVLDVQDQQVNFHGWC